MAHKHANKKHAERLIDSVGKKNMSELYQVIAKHCMQVLADFAC